MRSDDNDTSESVRCVQPQCHEFDANVLFNEHGLKPFFATDSRIKVAAARFTSSFGGLAIGQITLVVGWLGGWVEWEMAVASLFVALFIGLNVAANVDYQSGRLRT